MERDGLFRSSLFHCRIRLICSPKVIHFPGLHYNKSRQNGNANKASPGDYAVVNELYEGKPLPDAPKGVTPCVAASQSHNQTTCMLRKMAGTEHQILNHCPQSPAANLPLRGCLCLRDSWPIILSRLKAIIASSRTSALVANFPEGRRSTSMSVFSSL